MSDSVARKYIAAPAGRGQWSYINDDAKDFTHVIFDRLTSPNNYITRTNPPKLVKDIGKDPATGKDITEAVVFHHISDKDFDAPDKNKKFDVFYKGIKPNHLEKIGSTEKKRRNKNKEPKDIFSKKPFTSKPKPKPKKTNRHRRKRSPNQQRRW